MTLPSAPDPPERTCARPRPSHPGAGRRLSAGPTRTMTRRLPRGRARWRAPWPAGRERGCGQSLAGHPLRRGDHVDRDHGDVRMDGDRAGQGSLLVLIERDRVATASRRVEHGREIDPPTGRGLRHGRIRACTDPAPGLLGVEPRQQALFDRRAMRGHAQRRIGLTSNPEGSGTRVQAERPAPAGDGNDDGGADLCGRPPQKPSGGIWQLGPAQDPSDPATTPRPRRKRCRSVAVNAVTSTGSAAARSRIAKALTAPRKSAQKSFSGLPGEGATKCRWAELCSSHRQLCHRMLPPSRGRLRTRDDIVGPPRMRGSWRDQAGSPPGGEWAMGARPPWRPHPSGRPWPSWPVQAGATPASGPSDAGLRKLPP